MILYGDISYSVIINQDLQVTTAGLTIRNCIIYNGKLDVDEDVAVENTIIFNPSGDDIDIAAGKTVTAKNNCISDAASVGSGTYSDTNSTTLWSTNPLFVDTTDFKLQIGSPCIDAGDNSVWIGEASVTDRDGNNITDAEGNIIATNGVVDIGAKEWQPDILDATVKKVYWLFEVTDSAGPTTYYWSTIGKTYGGNSYTYKIRPNSFRGLRETRCKPEDGVIPLDALGFNVLDADEELTASNFEDGTVTVRLIIDDGNGEQLVKTSKFTITQCHSVHKELYFNCKTFLYRYLQGDYPNTKLVRDISHSSDPTIDDTLCVPVPFGTCYVPLRSLYITDQRYYLLGPTSGGLTYTISKVRSPREIGAKSEWDSGSYSFTQSTKTLDSVDWRVFQPIIADSTGNGSPDACGLWLSGEHFLDMPVKFSRSDTATMTNPADIIAFILEDFGVSASDIDTGTGSTFALAKVIFASWGLTFNGAFFYKQSREEVLATLLSMCHSVLRVTDKIELHVLQKTAWRTIDSSDIMQQRAGVSSFSYTPINEKQSDSGHVAFQESGEAQDEFLTALVAAKSTTNDISGETLIIPFVQDSQLVQTIGSLHYQLKFCKKANASFTGKGSLLLVRPGVFVDISGSRYGGDYSVLVDSVFINKDLSIDFDCSQFSEDIDDWDDLSPSSITFTDDDSTACWSPVISGPEATVTDGVAPNSLPGSVVVGSTPNNVLIDPSAPKIDILSNTTVTVRIGNLNGFLGYSSNLYGIAIGETNKYLKYDPTNGLRLAGAVAITGTLSSSDWAAAAGVRLDLDNKWLKMGGSNVTAAGAAAGIFLGLDTSYKFYVGDGSNNYLKYDGTNVSISTSLANAIVIKSGADISVEAGGDIILTGDDSNPGELILHGSSLSCSMYVVGAGDNLYIGPIDSGNAYFNFGYNVKDSKYAYTTNILASSSSYGASVKLQGNYGTSYGKVQCGNAGDGSYEYVEFAIYDGSTSNSLHFRNSSPVCFFPFGTKIIDLGTATACWDDAYADDWHDVADFFNLDSFDDLEAIKQIKGSGVIDQRTGLELINDDTLPEWMLSKHKITGEVLKDPDGKPYLTHKICTSLSWGAIRQLDERIAELERRQGI